MPSKSVNQPEFLDYRRRLWEIACPLPGSVPCDDARPLRIPGRLDGLSLGEALQALFPQVESDIWYVRSEQGLLLTGRGDPADLGRPVRGGEQYTHLARQVVEPGVAGQVELLHLDSALLVVNKPAPLPVHPCGQYRRNTLHFFLHQVWAEERLHPCHRLDANTSGVMVWARGKESARRTQAQFAAGTVKKVYLARVQGWPSFVQTVTELPLESEPGPGGVRDIAAPGQGKACRTEISVLEGHLDNTTTLEVRPITGRTNQIRVHLWHLGHPVVGDPAYLPGGRRSSKVTAQVGEGAMMLHCREIGLTHPLCGKQVVFSAGPSWI